MSQFPFKAGDKIRQPYYDTGQYIKITGIGVVKFLGIKNCGMEDVWNIAAGWELYNPAESDLTTSTPKTGEDWRDYFAAKAMQAILSTYGNKIDDNAISAWAYKQADSMLKKRGSK